MAKKFRGNGVWKEEWFKKTPVMYKLLWFWITDKCKGSGAFESSFKSFAILVGGSLDSIDPQLALDYFNSDGKIRLIKVSSVSYFLPYIKKKNIQNQRMSFKDSDKWKGMVDFVFKRDNYTCQYCGSTDSLECDHIIAFSKGGLETLDNLTVACRRCNRKKGNKPVDEFLFILKLHEN